MSQLCSRLWAALRTWIADPDAVGTFTVLRVGTAAVLLAKNVMEISSITLLYSDDGILPWSISDRAVLTIFPKLSVLSSGLVHLGLQPHTTVYLAFALYSVALAWMAMRPQHRLPVFVAWYMHLMFYGASFRSVYGLDCFANIALFYCVIGPNGAWRSMIATTREGDAADSASAFSNGLRLRLFQLNVCTVYLSATWAKAHGPDWWSGESIWRAVSQPQFSGAFSMLWLHHFPWVAKAAGWTTMAIEGLYPLCVCVPRLRRIGLLAVVGMHASMALILNLWLFSSIMIVMNVAAFGIVEVRLLATWLDRMRARVASVWEKKTAAATEPTPLEISH
jgi:hypothetical protein